MILCYSIEKFDKVIILFLRFMKRRKKKEKVRLIWIWILCRLYFEVGDYIKVLIIILFLNCYFDKCYDR